MMRVSVDWGRPLEFERRFVPAAAAASSLVLHSALLFAGFLRAGPGEPAEAELHVRQSRFALLVPRTSDARCIPKKEPPRLVPRPARRPRSSERESMTSPRLSAAAPAETELTRVETESPRAERVTVAEMELAGELTLPRMPDVGVRSASHDGSESPTYPPALVRDGVEGEGEYEVEIDEAGRVTSVRVLRSAGHPALDTKVELYFIHRGRYEPATLDGVPIPCTRRAIVAFTLEPRRLDNVVDPTR
jgi:TonB family protein